MIDIHCHLNFHSFTDDYDQVIKDAVMAGVKTIINVGTKIDSSEHAVKLAEAYDNLFAIVGVHPHHADKLTPERHPEQSEGSREETTEASIPHGTTSSEGRASLQNDRSNGWLEKLEAIAKHPKVIGIGECGMDYYSYASNGIVDPKLQRDIFEKQIELAYKLSLPLQIHHRQVGQEILDVLSYHKNSLLPVPGMFHCFAGDMDFLKKVLSMGFFIGIDGNVTYKGIAKGETTALPDIVAATPLDRLVTETDSPFLTPEPYRGTRNEPKYIPLVVAAIAAIKGLSESDVVEQTTKNVYTVFTKLPQTV